VNPWFLGINPRGVVPILVHDGVVHVESNDILKYLDSEIPSDTKPFFPVNESEQHFVAQNLELENNLHMDLRALTMGFIFPRRLVQKSEKTLKRWETDGIADLKREQEVKWWRDFAREGIPPQDARDSAEAHRKAFAILEDRLEASQWLIGDRLSVLDIAWFITTTRLQNAGYPLSNHPRLLAWHQRLILRPAFQEETLDPFPLRSIIAPLYQMFRRVQGTTLADLIEAG
jgi:glutathione S-transferase